jgi:hypothetical protein
MVEIAEEYRGCLHVAVTCYAGDFHYSIAGSEEALDQTIAGYTGPLQVLTRFPGINGEALNVLDEASQRLNDSQEVDLENLLSGH